MCHSHIKCFNIYSKSNLHDLIASINEKNQLQGQCVNVAWIFGRIAFSIPTDPPILVKEAACMFVPWHTCTSQKEWSVWTVNAKQLYQTCACLAIERNACLECLPLQGVDISWHIVPVWAEDQRLRRALTCPKPDPTATASLLCQVTFWSCSSSSLAARVAQLNHLTHRRAWPYAMLAMLLKKSWFTSSPYAEYMKQIKRCWEKYGQVMPSGSNAHCLQYTRQLLWMDMHSWADAQHRRQPKQKASYKLFESLRCDLRCWDQVLDSIKSHLS